MVNAVVGDLSQAMVLQMAQLKVETEEALLHMEQVMRWNHQLPQPTPF